MRDMFSPLPSDHAGCISLPSLCAAHVRIALGTIFTELGGAESDPCAYRAGDPESAHAAGLRQLQWYRDAEAKGKLRIITNSTDLDFIWNNTSADAPLGVVLLMECADPIRTPEEAAWWYAQGVRVVGMARAARRRPPHGMRRSDSHAGRSCVVVRTRRACCRHGVGQRFALLRRQRNGRRHQQHGARACRSV